MSNTVIIKNQNRIDWIDIAKGIGIFLVVFAHIKCPIQDEIYLFHMPLFFFLSGTLLKTNIDFNTYFKSKVQHLLFPFLFFLSISIPVRIMYLFIIKSKFTWFSFFNPTFSNVTLWFLPVLFAITLISYFIKKRIGRIAILLLSIFGLLIFGKYHFHFFSYIERISYCLPFFICGYFFTKYQNFLSLYAKIMIGIVSLIIFSIGIYLTITFHFRLDIIILKAEGGGISHFIVALSGILLIIFLSMAIQKIDFIIIYWIKLMGRNSLYIFTLHWIFIEPIWLFYPQQEIKDFGLILTCVLIIISAIIGILLKKMLPSVFK